MLHNSISVDMKVYALQLKQKSTASLRNFRTATCDKDFLGAASKKKTKKEKDTQ